MKHEDVCPKCGSTSVVPILYGEPSPEAGEAAKRGEVVLGGCCLVGDDPDRACRACGHDWRSKDAAH